jgi:hypothetical protein
MRVSQGITMRHAYAQLPFETCSCSCTCAYKTRAISTVRWRFSNTGGTIDSHFHQKNQSAGSQMSLCRVDISMWEAVFTRLMQRDLCNSTCRLWPLISTTPSDTASCSLYSGSSGSRQGPCGFNFWGLIDPANDIPYPVPVDPKRKEAWDSDPFRSCPYD